MILAAAAPVAAVLFVSPGDARAAGWWALHASTTPRTEVAAGRIRSAVYVAGGVTTRTLERYDPPGLSFSPAIDALTVPPR